MGVGRERLRKLNKGGPGKRGQGSGGGGEKVDGLRKINNSYPLVTTKVGLTSG